MLLFMDGQAHYDSAGIGLKYSALNTDACTWAVAAEGRFGNCVRRTSTASGVPPGYLAIAPLTTRLGAWAPTVSGVCGFAVKATNLNRAGGSNTYDPADLFVVMEGSLHHVKVTLNADGTLTLRRYNDATDLILAQSIEGLTEGAWAFVEFKWRIDVAAGSFEIRVNGITVLTFSGRTLESSVYASTGVWNSVRVLGVASTGSPHLVLRMCDLYLADLASSAAADVSDFLGDGVIQTILPDGVGATTGWTPSAGANWDAVNDAPAHDGDATYVAATTAGLKDTYSFQDVPMAALVKGVHVNILARKETEGSASVAPIVRQSGTDYVGPTQGVAGITYDRYVTQAWDFNPATNAKFTPSEVNAGQFGVQKVS